MLKFGFGGKLKPRKFDFIPRYYDEEKEELRNRLGKYEGDASKEEEVKHRIKSGFRQKYYGDNSYRKRETRKSNLRLLYIMIVLFFVCYLILKSDKITQLMQYLDS